MRASVKERWFPPLKRSTPLSEDRTKWTPNEKRLRLYHLSQLRAYSTLARWTEELEREFLELRLEVIGK